MSPVLEPGYIARLFEESIYLIGNPNEVEILSEKIVVQNIETKPEPALKPLPRVVVKNKKKLIVLTDKKMLTEDENTFISKLIAAVSLSATDAAIMMQTDFNKEEYDFEYLLQFGHSSKEKYKIHQEDGYSLLAADGLVNLTNSLDFKKLLWSSLQLMFNIKK